MQLFVAPVSYRALILMFELFIWKTVPVVGPTTIVQIKVFVCAMYIFVVAIRSVLLW